MCSSHQYIITQLHANFWSILFIPVRTDIDPVNASPTSFNVHGGIVGASHCLMGYIQHYAPNCWIA